MFVEEHDGLALLDVGARDDVVVSATNGDLIVHAVTAGRAASLSAGAGHITDDGDDATRLAAGELTLLARAIGAPGGAGTGLDSAARLDIEATTLQATATHGGLFIDEADGLADIRLAAGGDIELLTRTGDLHLRSVSAGDTLLLAAGGNLYALPDAGALTARAAELRAGTSDPSAGQIGTSAKPIELELGAGDTLRLYVPHTIDPNDPNRAPFTLPSAGVSTVLHRFHSPSVPAAQAGYGRFQGFDELNFTSPAETMLRSLQSQTGTVQSVLDIDWASFDPNVSLFGTLEPAVCLPSDQRDEEESTPEC